MSAREGDYEPGVSMTEIARIDAALSHAYGGVTTNTTNQKVMIVQIPSEAHAEKLICTRIGEANAAGWTVTQMMDHNGFLVLLLQQSAPATPETEA